jgi:hypothetical protein
VTRDMGKNLKGAYYGGYGAVVRGIGSSPVQNELDSIQLMV